MPSIDKIKGRFLFGTSEAASIPNLQGAGSLTYTAGVGGATYYSNYVDLHQGSRFTTPFGSLSRNRTIIIVGLMPYREWVYDTGDATNKWPLTVARAAAMTRADYILSWASGGYLGTSGSNLITDTPGGGTTPAWHTSEAVNFPIAYRDATFNWVPGLLILGQGSNGTGLYLGQTVGRNLVWSRNATAYTNNRSVPDPSIFGHVTIGGGPGVGTNCHTMLLGYAEYEWLTEAEALEAADEMVALLEARGWVNTFNVPTRTNIPLVTTGSGEGPLPPITAPAITAVNANFTVADSPVSGWKRITKVGGTAGVMEQAATSGLLPATWGVYIKDPSETAGWVAGASNQAGATGDSSLFGWKPNSPGNAFILRWEGAYIGSFLARITGGTYGVTRMGALGTGEIGRFVGDDKQTTADTFDASFGTTDAAFPMVFDCALSGIGHYIDVKIA